MYSEADIFKPELDVKFYQKQNDTFLGSSEKMAC